MNKKAVQAGDVARYLLIAVYLLVALFPIYWLVTLSVRDLTDILAIPPNIIPKSFTLVNFQDVILGTGITEKQIVGAENTLPFLANSLIVGSLSTAICMVIGTLAAYGLFKGNPRIMNPIAFAILAIRMVPPVILITPLFIIFKSAGMLDKRTSLALVYAAFNIPFAVWMMRGFFMDVPVELEDAAMIDGCGPLGAFVRVILPIVKPGLAATAVFVFLQAWNEFFFAVILTRSTVSQTLPVAASFFVREGMSQRGVNIGAIAVVGTIAVLPMIIFVALVQKWLVRGLTFGAVKG
jgi:multiple sugar transport system permease protein